MCTSGFLPPDNAVSGSVVTIEMVAMWLFITLTVRFHEACYFYELWEYRRFHGLEKELLPPGKISEQEGQRPQ